MARARLVVFALVTLIVACDNGSPTAPRLTNTPSAPAPSPAPQNVVLNLLELSAPSSIPPGGTARVTVTASYSDGSYRDVTNEAAWRVQSTSVLSIAPGGVITGLERGQASLQASFGGKTSSKTILVLPDGTFRLFVSAWDSHVPVRDAQILVRAGDFEATGQGSATFYGVAGDVEVRVIASGYLEYKHRLNVVAHQQLDVVLTLAQPREFVEGIYTLVVSAAPECRSTLPAELAERKYVADIAQIDRSLIMTLMGPAFASRQSRRLNWFRGTLFLDRMTFGLTGAWPADDYYFGASYGLPEVLEELTPTTFFSMFGTIEVTGSSTRKAGSLDGTIEVIGPPPRFNRIAACKSSGHGFVLTR